MREIEHRAEEIKNCRKPRDQEERRGSRSIADDIGK